jgi:hypothetical protein
MNIVEVVNRIEKMNTVYYESDNQKTKNVAKIGWLYPRYIVPLLWIFNVSLVALKLMNWFLLVYVMVFFLAGKVLLYVWWQNLRKQRLGRK